MVSFFCAHENCMRRYSDDTFIDGKEISSNSALDRHVFLAHGHSPNSENGTATEKNFMKTRAVDNARFHALGSE